MFEPRETDVLVLAGGLGTRLRAVVSDRPKPMAAIHGRPFISYVLEQIAAAGFRRAILCVGHRAEQVEALLGPVPGGLEIVFSREEQQLGTAGALGLAAPLVRSERALVLNGDSFIDADFARFGTWADESPFAAALLAVHVDDAGRYGTLELADDGRVVAFREKEGGAEPGWISAGAYLLPHALLAAIRTDRPRSLETDVFPDWAERGALGAWCARVRFIDIGTPESYAVAAEFFESERAG
jgi:NDP-sugar pyrophosphorylase family protein